MQALRSTTCGVKNSFGLQTLFAANRRLFKAYVLREQLDRLWTYKTRPGVLNFVLGWIRALRGSDCLKWNAWETSSPAISRVSPPIGFRRLGGGFGPSPPS